MGEAPRAHAAIATAKSGRRPELARQPATPDAIDAITPLQSVATTMMQRGQRYVERMAGVTEGVLPHLEAMPHGELLDRNHEVEKYDRDTRRTFGLGDGTNGNGFLSINVLRNQAAVFVTPGRPAE